MSLDLGIVCAKGDMIWQVQSIVSCMVLCAPRVPIFFKVNKKNLVLLFGFPPVTFLIPNRFQCIISQMKEKKFLIKCLIHYFRVGVMPSELWSHEFTVQLLLCAHCIVTAGHTFLGYTLVNKRTRIWLCKCFCLFYVFLRFENLLHHCF